MLAWLSPVPDGQIYPIFLFNAFLDHSFLHLAVPCVNAACLSASSWWRGCRSQGLEV